MKEFSGGISNPNFKSEDISTKNPEINLINEFSPNQEEEENIILNPISQVNNIFSKNNEDNEEIEYVMQSMENLRINHSDSFEFVINTTKEVLDIINKKELKGRELIKKLDSLFKEVEKMDIDYLFWCAHKSLKIAIIEQHNIDLVHFFIIRKGFNLSNKSIHKNLINDFLKSFPGVDFINGSQEDIAKNVCLLQMLLNEGKCDVNDTIDDPVRNSPLHYCIIFNQLQFFIVLLKFKYTNINKINLNGDTPLDFACENVIYNHEFLVNKEFAKLLIQHGGKTNNMKHKYNELLKILINEGEEVGLEHKIELISENNNKTKSKNKSGEGSCCTISTKSLEDEKIEGDNKEDTGNKIENKTIIIGKEKEKKDEDDKKDKNEIKPNICTKTVSF
jgi:ankyrin repeat protein